MTHEDGCRQALRLWEKATNRLTCGPITTSLHALKKWESLEDDKWERLCPKNLSCSISIFPNKHFHLYRKLISLFVLSYTYTHTGSLSLHMLLCALADALCFFPFSISLFVWEVKTIVRMKIFNAGGGGGSAMRRWRVGEPGYASSAHFSFQQSVYISNSLHISDARPKVRPP